MSRLTVTPTERGATLRWDLGDGQFDVEELPEEELIRLAVGLMGFRGWSARAGLHAAYEVLCRAAERGWPFSEESYPLQPEGGPEGTQAEAELLSFRASHALLHLQKQAGRLAALFEPLAHGGPLPDPEEVARQCSAAVVDAIRLALLRPVRPCASAGLGRAAALWAERSSAGAHHGRPGE